MKEITVGSKWGKLTVIEKYEKYPKQGIWWKCKCDCGNFTDSNQIGLQRYHITSCGCNRPTKLSGKRYGRLLVISQAGQDSWGKSTWWCQCDCGKQKIINISELNQGQSKSCGCLHNELLRLRTWKGCGEISGNIFDAIKRKAKIRNYEFSVTIEYLWELFLQQNRRCSLSGEEISFPISHRKIDNAASLDRIDNSKGYIIGNVQWVHKSINLAKHILDEKEFKRLCKKVTEYQPNKEIIVCASGYFNPLHQGHLKYLENAKTFGTKLIVIVNNDDQCLLKKNIIFLDELTRLTIIKNLKMVDEAILSIDKDLSVSQTLQYIKPNIFVNGGDVNSSCREEEICKNLKIQIVYEVGGASKEDSSTDILNNFLAQVKDKNVL